MLRRSFMILNIGFVIVGCMLLTGFLSDSGIRRGASFTRIGLSGVLWRELSGGRLGGVRCDELVGSLPSLAWGGAWESSVYDPDERCWYLTGWIEDERVDCRRMSLTLWPIAGSTGGLAWRFHLVCTSLPPAEPACVEIEGAWRCGNGQTRIVWTATESETDEVGIFQTCMIRDEPRPGGDWKIAGVR